jgi:hypothetical protein
MMTRRNVLGGGAAFAALVCTSGSGVSNLSARRYRDAGSIDALLVDETIEMPRQIAAFIQARRHELPVIGVQLDAAAHADLMRAMDQSHALVGISSGATLFCLERMAWDHGFRLIGRSQRCVHDFGDDAHQQDVAAFLSDVRSPAARSSSCARAYRPSRVDETLHAWSMQRSARSQLHADRREVWS